MPTIFNPALVALAADHIKQAFVDAATAGGAGGDPAAAAGGAPPMDPAMGGGMGGDPAAGGAMPGPDPMAEINMLKQQIASMGSGGAGGGMEPIKPKIDINVEIMQMKKLIARLCDALGVQIPAAEMTATSTDLTQMAQQSQQASGAPAPAQSAIQPISPLQGAMPTADAGAAKQAVYAGSVFDPAFSQEPAFDLTSSAERLLRLINSRNQ